ncbi:hypothetical protein SAMN04488066_11420 [Halorubrum aquaticum]|uniref:DnaJ central domain-containing protein n=1 Tax=Halorubrum aquaticum TaxID=387340 RepID=A0A1I3BNJ7_9EURY|nr:hypothetical protein [Halorubrum aquaticum]SFH63865.1 hypothetical protein SAMN04488066_11420 [Halorubrum aquaticum]
MTETRTPKELLERIGKSEYHDVSETTTKEEGQYVATATRRLQYVGRSTETVIEADDRFRNREFAPYNEHPDGYDGHDLPTPADWAREHGKGVLDSDGDEVIHELKRVSSRNEEFGECPTCEGTGRTICPKCDGTGRKPCSVCYGSGEKTVYDPCDACAGQGDVERTEEEQCRVCGGDKHIERNGVDVPCPNCDGTGTEERTKQVDCEVCNGSGERSRTEPCQRCDQQHEETCENCDESDHVECDQCTGDGEVWEYERVTDRYQVELDVSVDPSPSAFARGLIAADEIEWERVDDETHEVDSLPDGSGIIREQKATLRTPMQIVAYSPVEASSIYDGKAYEPWKGGAQIERVGAHVEAVTADFGEITRPGFGTFLRRVVYALPLGFVLAIVLALGLTQLDSAYGLVRNAVGGVVAVAVLATAVVSSTGYALGIVMIGLFAASPALGVASTEQAMNGILFGTLPIVIGTAPIVYRYVKYNW